MPTTRLRARRATLSLCTLAALCAGAAKAQDGAASPYFIGVSQSLGHESNMLRLADGARTPEGFSRSDNLSSTSLLGGFDQKFGRQRAYANVAVRENRYSSNSTFDNRSYNGTAGLDWSTIERVSGTLTASANRSLQRFSTAEVNLVTTKNLETVETFGGTANIGVVTKYSFDVGASRRQVRNSVDEPAVQSRNFNQEAYNAGVRWSPSSDFSTSVGWAGTRGRYPRFRTAADGEYIADRFKRNDFVMSTNYRASGASNISLRLSHGRTRYDLSEQRDFSGTTGSLSWNWVATGKLRLHTSFNRDTGQDSYSTTINAFPGVTPVLATADYSRVVTTYGFGAHYAATGKVSVNAGLLHTKRDLVRTIDSTLARGAEGRDRTNYYTLGVRWAVLRAATLGCSYSNEQRNGRGDLVAPMNNSGYSCYGQVTLQ